MNCGTNKNPLLHLLDYSPMLAISYITYIGSLLGGGNIQTATIKNLKQGIDYKLETSAFLNRVALPYLSRIRK